MTVLWAHVQYYETFSPFHLGTNREHDELKCDGSGYGGGDTLEDGSGYMYQYYMIHREGDGMGADHFDGCGEYLGFS
jgi:hypothetical protein